jgi:hypothetical protein
MRRPGAGAVKQKIMKQVMSGLNIALLVIFCTGGPQFARAQGDGPLEKKVKVKAENEHIEDVLKDLAKQGYFTFSYKSDIFKKDRTITLTIKESTLREALEQILGRDYGYLETDNYVIIRPRGPEELRVAVPARKSMMARKSMVAREQPREGMMPPAPKAPRMPDSVKITVLRQTVRNIIGDMVADGIVRDKDSFLWFGLDNGQFVVDGKQMADSLRVKYAAKYIKADGYGYYYGSVSVRGRGYFLDKKDVYGDGKQ